MASCNFITDELLHRYFSGILSKWTPANGYFLFLYKILEKNLRTTFLLYQVLKFCNFPWNKQFPRGVFKRGNVKNFSKFTDEYKKQSSGDVLSREVLTNFGKFTCKHLCWSLFFNKVAGWKTETVRRSHWRCSVRCS